MSGSKLTAGGIDGSSELSAHCDAGAVLFENIVKAHDALVWGATEIAALVAVVADKIDIAVHTAQKL